jgi:hypothetical protein
MIKYKCLLCKAGIYPPPREGKKPYTGKGIITRPSGFTKHIDKVHEYPSRGEVLKSYFDPIIPETLPESAVPEPSQRTVLVRRALQARRAAPSGGNVAPATNNAMASTSGSANASTTREVARSHAPAPACPTTGHGGTSVPSTIHFNEMNHLTVQNTWFPASIDPGFTRFNSVANPPPQPYDSHAWDALAMPTTAGYGLHLPHQPEALSAGYQGHSQLSSTAVHRQLEWSTRYQPYPASRSRAASRRRPAQQTSLNQNKIAADGKLPSSTPYPMNGSGMQGFNAPIASSSESCWPSSSTTPTSGISPHSEISTITRSSSSLAELSNALPPSWQNSTIGTIPNVGDMYSQYASMPCDLGLNPVQMGLPTATSHSTADATDGMFSNWIGRDEYTDTNQSTQPMTFLQNETGAVTSSGRQSALPERFDPELFQIMYGSDILPELNFDFGGQNGGN